MTCDSVETKYKKTDYIEYVNTELKNPGTKEASINSVTKITKEIPTDSEVTLKVEQKVGDKFEGFGMPMSFNVCDFLSKESHFAPHVMKKGNYSLTCPYKPGVYAINDMKLNELQSLPIELDSGTYKLLLIVKIAGELIESSLTCKTD